MRRLNDRRLSLTGALIAGALALGAVVGCADDPPGPSRSAATTGTDPVVEIVRQQARMRANSGRADFTAPSLSFPVGTDFAHGLRQIFLMEAGLATADGARVEGPLPEGAIVSLPAPEQQLRISLAAPYGYDAPDGRPLMIPMRAPDAATDGPMSEAGPWRKGSALPVPTLPECMISRGGAAPKSPCARHDVAALRGDAIPLP